MQNKIKWILILYFIILLYPVFFLTWLGYSDSNENPLIILVGSIFLIVFLVGAYSSFRLKKKNDFTKASLMVPLFISLVTLFFGVECMFSPCDTYLVFALGSAISLIILYFYIKLIKKYVE